MSLTLWCVFTLILLFLNVDDDDDDGGEDEMKLDERQIVEMENCRLGYLVIRLDWFLIRETFINYASLFTFMELFNFFQFMATDDLFEIG